MCRQTETRSNDVSQSAVASETPVYNNVVHASVRYNRSSTLGAAQVCETSGASHILNTYLSVTSGIYNASFGNGFLGRL